MTATSKVTKNGTVTIPKAFREILNAEPGSLVVFKSEKGKIVIEQLQHTFNKQKLSPQQLKEWKNTLEALELQAKNSKMTPEQEDGIMEEVIAEIKLARRESNY
jgi:AbrB family looped-hinge helix DNA binding protein